MGNLIGTGARLVPLVWGVVGALLLGSSAVAGDKDVAELLYQKGIKASREKNWTEAESCFKRAITEFSPYPDAAFGWGEALEKLGRDSEACAAYGRCLDEISASPPPASKWKALASKAEKAVARLGKGNDELARLDREFVDACIKLARGCQKTSPVWARRACEAALAVEPGNAAAKGCLAGLGDGKAPDKQRDAAWTELCGEDGLSLWDPGESDHWSCVNGVIVGEATPKVGQLNWRADLKLEGRYSVTGTFRILEEQRSGLYGIFFGGRDRMRTRTEYYINTHNELLLEATVDDETSTVKSHRPKGFDRKARHTMRVEIEAGRVRCFLDGEEVFSYLAEASSAFDGAPGILVQGGKIEIRDVRLRR